ncbi:MAG: hypothetical protein RLY31_707 [Bacteroidota bacterium]|jgi:DNA ligase (NAD+)
MYTQEEQRRLADRSLALQDAGVPAEQEAAGRLAAELRDLLRYHDWRYYALDSPVISDFAYDTLYHLLKAVEGRFPELVRPDSPTQRVSGGLTEDFRTVEHLTPMLSLDNSYDAADLFGFDERLRNYLGLPADQAVSYCVEPKFDGGTIALVYEHDQLVRAATRGNGFAGDDITPNIRTVRSVPLQAAFSKHGIVRVELRGEAIIRKDVFRALNELRAEDDQPLFANPRNAATGGLRTKDPSETAARRIEAFVYQLGFAEDAQGRQVLEGLRTHDATIDLLESLGFKVPRKTAEQPERKVCADIREVVAFCDRWQADREAYPYEIDGMVVKVDDLQLQRRAGSTAHHPRWAIAFKFRAKQATTKLTGVDFQVGKVGNITPVAKLEPVRLAGVSISSVSLHNEDFIRNKDIRLGDIVLVERAGDVIPYIVKPMEELRDGSETPIAFPKNCPVCHAPLVRQEDEAAWRCENPSCEAQLLQRMIHHVSKNAMDIDGFGEAIVERFYRLGWLHDLADIYRLDYGKIANLENFGERSAANLRAAIERAKRNPIHRLLHSLSIHHLGIRASKLLAAEIRHVLELCAWDEARFLRIQDIGPVVAHNVMRYFQRPENVAMLREMESLGVNLTQTEDDRPVAVAADAPLSGKTILFTGTLTRMGRKEAQARATAAGARNISAVSGNLDILVIGEAPGSKLRKAQSVGTVRILTEDEFLALTDS